MEVAESGADSTDPLVLRLRGEEKLMKAVKSALFGMRVATLVFLESVLRDLWEEDAIIYISKTEKHRQSGEFMEFSVGAGYALRLM